MANWEWPKELTAYLKKRLPIAATDSAGHSKFVWQGLVRNTDSLDAGYLYPVLDSVRGSEYFTVFNQRILVALKGESSKPKAKAPGK